ncbi:MAG: LPS assembly protein LptD [Desulfobacteraceae bacterium]
MAALFLVVLEASALMAFDRSIKDKIVEDEGARWEITARKMSYREKEGLYVAEGDVVISREGQVLSAERAKYNEKTGIVEVSGNVILEANGDLLTGEHAIFNLNTQQGQMSKGRLFIREHHYYISGDSIEKTGAKTYRVKNCRLTTCDGEKPDWSITGSEVEVTIEGYGTVKHTVFRIRDFPAFYIPYAIFPVKTKRQTGLLPPRVGYSSRNGVDVEVPFFWAIADQTDATFYERFMDERGFMQGFESRYVAEGESKGIVLFDILSDKIEDKDLSDPEEVDLSPFPRTNETRYWLRSRTDQQLPLGLRVRFDTDFVSDQDYLKEFQGGLFGYQGRPDLSEVFGRPVEEIQSPTRRSALRLAHDGESYSLQGLTSYYQRPENPSDDDTPQPLGGLNLGILPRSFQDMPLFFRLDTDYDYIWRDVGQKGHRASFTPGLSYPMWFGRYLAFEPSLSYTGTAQWIDDDTGDNEHQSRNAYDLQARLSTILERIFDIDWMHAKEVKHKFFPSLTYEYRVPKDQDKPQPWFEAVDVEGKINRITLALENLLDARTEDDKGQVQYKQWGTFNLVQGYDIDEARGDEDPGQKKKPFEPLIGELDLKLFPYIDLDAEARWDYYDDDFSYADVALGFNVPRSGGRYDHFTIDYEYVKDGTKSLNYSLNINLIHGFSAGSSQKRDLNLDKNIERRYWLDYQSQCWGVRVIAESLDEVDTFMVTFRLLGLGDIGSRQ